jgi:hypothetical protein
MSGAPLSRIEYGKLKRNHAVFVNLMGSKVALAQGASQCAASPSQLIESTAGFAGTRFKSVAEPIPLKTKAG